MLKAKTSLGLRLVDTQTNEYFPQKKATNEFHFFKMEGLLGEANYLNDLFGTCRELRRLTEV